MLHNLQLTQIFACAGARWSPKIGDPNLTGWATVAAYLACAALSVAVLRRVELNGRARGFWFLLSCVMVFLAINKQLDLQSALTATGRCIAQLQGWYGERRGFQKHFIMALLAIFAALLLLGLYLLRHELRANGLALLGLIVVAAYVAVRAVGFHHFDALINERLLDLRFNFIFEVSGLVLVSLNALVLLYRSPRRQAQC